MKSTTNYARANEYSKARQFQNPMETRKRASSGLWADQETSMTRRGSNTQ